MKNAKNRKPRSAKKPSTASSAIAQCGNESEDPSFCRRGSGKTVALPSVPVVVKSLSLLVVVALGSGVPDAAPGEAVAAALLEEAAA